MSDSFADLWSTSAPTKPAQPARKLGGSAAPSATGTRRPQYDAFSRLAASGSASPSSRSVTPSAPAITAQRSNGGTPPTSGDAFGDLLSGSFASNPSSAKLSMAEKAARARSQTSQQSVAPVLDSSAWAGLDSLAGNASISSSKPSQPPASNNDDEWFFGPSVASTQSKPSSASESLIDDLGLEDFASHPTPPARPSPSSQAPSSQTDSVWELDDFTSLHQPQRRPSSPPHRESPPIRSGTPGDFDFGDRENRLLDDGSGSEEDILGDLSRPIRDRRERRSPPITTHSPSPPPHLIGQIVEMGFSPDQARVALASTDTGLDVQAALETLLADTSRSSPSIAEGETPREPRRQRRFQDDDDWGTEPQDTGLPQRRPRQQHQVSQDRPQPSSSDANYQQQADKIIAQASEIGSQLFQRANAFWKEGKSKVQKAYEERAAASRPGSTHSNERQSGRPRWMQESVDHDQPTSPEARQSRHTFKDEDRHEPPAARPPAQPRPRLQAKPSSAPSQPKIGDLFGEDMPSVYVSPFRRGASSRAVSTSSPALALAAAKPVRAPSPIRLVERKVVSVSASTVSASAKHKASGTEMFKLGRFAEAESAYTLAISQLPESHLLLVPLLNNRGLARLKTGDMAGAIEDCSTVISIVGPSYHPAREAKVTKEEDGASVDLADGLIKAWRRRAEAYEGREKWDLARQDWESIAGADFAGRHRSDALSGIGRCRKMINAEKASDGDAVHPPRANPPKPAKRSPPRRGPTPPSEAVERLKQANQEAEAEDQARYELKDGVDARLNAWKNGKETNIRALVASLDTVLWPELGWQKVGMAELVMPNQVKIRYTKAIAKLHPDKINAKNTTLEQRMIANGVFGALNDAWNAFKP
ncbi:hypothetical protein BC834DRAFT_867836 [Gloeopeniophorella convolvens]|nr:hypothetical protein BC834DRAFT_867836 [Gloeopeniophorella convolvens]